MASERKPARKRGSKKQEAAAPADQETSLAKVGDKTMAKTDEAVNAALLRGDLKAAQRIGTTFLELRDHKDKLKEERKRLNGLVAAAHAKFVGAVEAPDDGTPAGGRAKLNDLLQAWQDEEDEKARKKDELHILLARKKELEGRLDKQIEGARQLGLFDAD